MDALLQVARHRAASALDNSNTSFAEVENMTDAEREELHRMRMVLPTPGEESAAARARIAAKLERRRQQ